MKRNKLGIVRSKKNWIWKKVGDKKTVKEMDDDIEWYENS